VPAPRPRRRPTAAELEAASGRRVPDVVAPGLRVLFCGINPGLWSAAVGHHFARPGNRFWTALHASGFTDELLGPDDERRLLERGLGITNLVDRATASAAELEASELRAGAPRLAAKLRRLSPAALAVLGVGAYRLGFGRPGAGVGEQPESISGVRVWVLPNPSGAQASYSLEEMVAWLVRLRRAVDEAPGRPGVTGPG